MQLSSLQRRWLKLQKRFQKEQPTLRQLLSLSAVAMVTPLMVIGIGVAILASVKMMFVAMFMAGMGIGAFLRDFGRLRIAARLWPVSHHVMDWQKVDELLEEDSFTNPHAHY